MTRFGCSTLGQTSKRLRSIKVSTAIFYKCVDTDNLKPTTATSFETICLELAEERYRNENEKQKSLENSRFENDGKKRKGKTTF